MTGVDVVPSFTQKGNAGSPNLPMGSSNLASAVACVTECNSLY